MRCFVIGNGKSLERTPMNLLRGEHSIATNKINEIISYYGWSWKPTHYYKMDYGEGEDLQSEVLYHMTEKVWLWDKWQGMFPDLKRVTWVHQCKHHPYMFDNVPKVTQSWHLPALCTALNSISAMVQIMVLEGFDEIYLLGCDLGYEDFQDNHAIPGYIVDPYKGRSYLENGNVLAAHKLIKRCSPVPVYNASIGGELEVYPRADIYEILGR